MAASFAINPAPLGKITVAAAGTPVSVLTNFPAAGNNANNGVNLNAYILTVTALAANTNNIYVGTATMNKSTLVGVLAIIAPGVTASLGVPGGASSLDTQLFYLDADTSGNAALVIAYSR